MLWLKKKGCCRPTPQRTLSAGAGRRRKTHVQVLLPLRPLNPHKRTRNSLRFSEIRAPAKCSKAGSRGTGQHGQYLGRGISSGLQAQGGKTAAGLPNRELGPVLALPPSNQTTGEGVPRGVAGSDPIPSTRPAAPLASGLLLTPGRTSEAKEPAQPLLRVLGSALSLEWSWVTRMVATQHLPEGHLLDCGCHPLAKGTHQHHSAHPVFGERLLCASGRLLRRHPCSGCRTTSTPQDWAP